MNSLATRSTLEARAASAPARPDTPVGFEAGALDDTIRTYIAVAGRAIRQAESLSKKLDAALENLEKQALAGGTDAMAEAEKLVSLHDRMTKSGLQLTKSLDELSRLRSFCAGGPTERVDLKVVGEIQLRAILLAAVKELGMKVVES